MSNADAEWLTVEEIAEALKVAPKTVRTWVASGDLKGVHLGHRVGWRIRRADYEAWLERKARESYEGR